MGIKINRSDFLGVPIDQLLLMLKSTSIKAHLDGNALVARNEHYTTRIEVVPPENRETEDGPIQAVVRIVTELPSQLQAYLKEPAQTTAMNSFAALGALTSERGKIYVGSRLTIYEGDDAWHSLYLPLLAFTAICGTEAILGGMRRSLTGEVPQGGASVWTERDLDQVHHYLSRICFCNTSPPVLTAEFGLVDGAVSAIEGHRNTALFQLLADKPHPELKGGLFSILQMPHQISDEKHLHEICVRLNNMEMAAHDLPPHFGAWCVGQLENNPAYISFLPNELHLVSGIAVNAAAWAIGRASWANTVLASLGVDI